MRACVRACVRVCVRVQYPAVSFCVCSISTCIIYVCAQIRVWSCLVTDNFGLFTEIAVCNFLRGLAVVIWPEPFSFCPLCVYKNFKNLFVHTHFSAFFFFFFCTTHCALGLARCHVPQICPLLYCYHCAQRFPAERSGGYPANKL